MIEIRRILCPVDFSDCSRRALDHAMAMARWYGSKVTALHVYPLPPVAAAPTGPIIFEPMLLTVEMRAQLASELKRLLLAEAAPGVETDVVLLEGGAAAGILEQAARTAADLIVMGTHGRSGVAHFFVGSVAERVVRSAPCPVFTVRDAEALRCATVDRVAAKAS
jgi:nucleotide-binding universal stress UspA family protein